MLFTLFFPCFFDVFPFFPLFTSFFTFFCSPLNSPPSLLLFDVSSVCGPGYCVGSRGRPDVHARSSSGGSWVSGSARPRSLSYGHQALASGVPPWTRGDPKRRRLDAGAGSSRGAGSTFFHRELVALILVLAALLSFCHKGMALEELVFPSGFLHLLRTDLAIARILSCLWIQSLAGHV